MSGIYEDAVTIAEELLRLVRSIAEPTPGPEGPSRHIKMDPWKVWSTKQEIQRTCDQLLVKTMGPMEFTTLLAESCHESQALHFVTTLAIPDHIGDGESKVHHLSVQAGVSRQHLAIAMNCLLGRGYFEEVNSEVYRNNDLSNVLREGHSLSLKSAVGFIGDEGFRATSCLLDAARGSINGEKQLPAANIAFGFTGSIFEWMSNPERKWRGERMGKAMQQLHRTVNVNVPDDYDWHALQSPIVDVGGGIGTLEMSLLEIERNRNLEFVVFDIPGTIENAEKVWLMHSTSGSLSVTFVAGNFMAPSLIESNLPQGKPTYMIRHVLHDWNDQEVVSILKMVRRAMPKHGVLLLVEMLLHVESSRFVRTTSMQLLALNNGVTRTQL